MGLRGVAPLTTKHNRLWAWSAISTTTPTARKSCGLGRDWIRTRKVRIFIATIMMCIRQYVKLPVRRDAGRRYNGHGRQQGGLALGRLAATIILGRGGDVRMARQVSHGDQVRVGVEQGRNPGMAQVVWTERRHLGSLGTVLQNPGHRLIGQSSRQESAALANRRKQWAWGPFPDGQTLQQHLGRAVPGEQLPIL